MSVLELAGRNLLVPQLVNLNVGTVLGLRHKEEDKDGSKNENSGEDEGNLTTEVALVGVESVWHRETPNTLR